MDIGAAKAFLGEGPRTLFHIHCASGVKIQAFSYYAAEEEVLLLPGTQYDIVNVGDVGGGVVIVELTESKASREFAPMSAATAVPACKPATVSNLRRCAARVSESATQGAEHGGSLHPRRRRACGSSGLGLS